MTTRKTREYVAARQEFQPGFLKDLSEDTRVACQNYAATAIAAYVNPYSDITLSEADLAFAKSYLRAYNEDGPINADAQYPAHSTDQLLLTVTSANVLINGDRAMCDARAKVTLANGIVTIDLHGYYEFDE